MTSRDKDAPAPLHELLAADHEEMRALCDDFLEAVHANNWTTADAVFTNIELLIDRHLAFEEQLVFPVFEEHRDVAPQQCDTTKMLAQHAEIRATLGEVGVGLQLHQVREPAMQNLVHVLDRHAADEDAWAAAVLECMKEKAPPGIVSRLRSLLPRIPGRSH